MKKNEENPEIEEIKTILEQLQNMQVPVTQPAQENARGFFSPIADKTSQKKSANLSRRETQKQSPHLPVQEHMMQENMLKHHMVQGRRETYIFIFIFLIFIGIAGYFVFIDRKDTSIARDSRTDITQTRKPSSIEQLTSDKVSTQSHHVKEADQTIIQIKQLVKSGKIVMARRLLIKTLNALPNTQDAYFTDLALLMAQSHDPNILRTLPSIDTFADVIEAEHWYRIWHQSVLEQGTLPKNTNLEDIIGTLRKN